MKVEVFTMSHNESHLIPYFVGHYRRCFPDCDITIFDNESTDNTADISRELGCKVISVASGGFVDQIKSDIHSQCWKNSQADWVVVCDTDEFLQINQAELEELDRSGVSILKVRGFDMVGKGGNPEKIKDKYPNKWYCKQICFNRTKIDEINYNPGAHLCRPKGTVQWSPLTYDLFHFKYISLDLLLERARLRFERMSEENRQKDFSWQYFQFNESKIRREYSQAWMRANFWRLFGGILGYELGCKLLTHPRRPYKRIRTILSNFLGSQAG